ncbi:MAG: type II toxin-antitoxin system VapC family toxin [Methanosphaera sp.]|nr:type II toxin-antitoxin system VapC family toxin [Methanosphaera sp.]
MKIILDSCYLVGLVLENDQWHKFADSLSYQVEKHDTYITNIILAETMNSFQCLGGKRCKQIYDIILETNTLININDTISYDKSAELLCDYDASIGYSDCTTIETMKKHDIKYIVSFDSDFDKKEGIVRIYNFKDKNNNYITNFQL